MVPQWSAALCPKWCTQAEFDALLLRRLDALDSCTREYYEVDHYPVQWRVGWRAEIRYAGRDRDGSLLATITITGPEKCSKWLQKVRLVRRERLNLHRR
jgi:hypothetical protein